MRDDQKSWSMVEQAIVDPNNLLLPLGNRIGAIERVKSLVSEMTHPNIDWKFVVNGLRSYLYDYLYDAIPYDDRVFPVIYHYLREATLRKRGSSLRASDTFFDRYIYCVKSQGDANTALLPAVRFFDSAISDYMDILIRESDEGFYFTNVNERVLYAGELLSKNPARYADILRKINNFLASQYSLYVGRSIVVAQNEIENLQRALGGDDRLRDLMGLLESVSEIAYADAVRTIGDTAKLEPAEAFGIIAARADFSGNAKAWEKICFATRQRIEDGTIADDGAILALLSYCIKKSSEGGDSTLQLFISRSVASVCSVLDALDKGALLQHVVDMVMPALLNEIESGGNYYSAFATICNIGGTVVESGRVRIIDHFVDILIKSKFCFPEFSGIAADWSVIVNSSHLENIRTWMRLIEINPPVMKRLAAALIVNLKLGGVFLKDTDVFQRDISRLLNSNYRDVFYLITSLAAVFPAFYHDIGATGNIRAFTEKIDANHQMNDLMHFMRKQVHVESSSRTVLLLQRIMDFWMTGDKNLLKNMVPGEVFENLDRAFRIMNLDGEAAASAICARMMERFRDVLHAHFWDFLNAVGKKEFLERAAAETYEGFTDDEIRDALACFAEYFDAQIPTETGKMLHHIRSMFDIDISKTTIWKFLYEISDEDFREMFANVRFLDVSRVNVEKFITFLHVYRMIYDKYNFSEVRDIEKLMLYADEHLFEPPDGFFERLTGADMYDSLDALLALQNTLKNDILLSANTYEPVDTIEFKRHIAFGIPSMYGSYKERKFDTLKVFFHCNLIRERFFNSLMESSTIFPHESINYGAIKRLLVLFYKTFEIDGLANYEFRSIISLLEAPNLTILQFRDIVTTLFSIHGEISDLFNETYKYVCKIIIDAIGLERIASEYTGAGAANSIEVIIDRFLRNQIMQSPLLQLFDNLLIRLKDRVTAELEMRGDVVCLNAADARAVKGELFYAIRRTEGVHRREELFVPLWLAGAKAQGLVVAVNLDGMNVPEGIVISSELYSRLRDGDINNPRFQRKVIYVLKKYIDRFTRGRFANPENPVLLSVRSGAVFSMPGVMDTITNVGITQEIIDYYALQDPWFAYDCYRRLIHDFAISAYGMDRAVFERLMAVAKDEAGVDLKEKITGRQMEALTKKYRYAINRVGFSIPKDPYEQLYLAIAAVFQSWDSTIARNYRRFVNIADRWGTAVIIQEMVFGNRSPLSITGVAHSHYLGKENIGLFGEYKTRAQGHDIVSGIARVFPISEEQRVHFERSSPFPSLEKTYPALYKMVYDAVKKIRNAWGNEIEIEFTIDDGVLYILQIRGMSNHIFITEELEDSPEDLRPYLLGQGLAASGGAVSGRAVFDIARIDEMRGRFPSDKIIIVRPETNPEDVIGIQKSDGMLTSVGGMTSHAVLQMRRLEKSGVSDFSAMKIDEQNNIAIVNRETPGGKVIIREGDFITIDGHTGHVYLGYHRTVVKGM